MKKVAFFDRDGTINEDPGYIYRPEDFKFVPYVVNCMRRLKNLGYEFVIVTNQYGVAKGKFSLKASYTFSRKVQFELEKEGIKLTAILTCPHHPDGVVSKYAKVCNCRKPSGGLIEEYIYHNDVDYQKSLIVGNKLSDIKAGLNAGLRRGILIGTDDDGAKIKDFSTFLMGNQVGFMFEHFENYEKWTV